MNFIYNIYFTRITVLEVQIYFETRSCSHDLPIQRSFKFLPVRVENHIRLTHHPPTQWATKVQIANSEVRNLALPGRNSIHGAP